MDLMSGDQKKSKAHLINMILKWDFTESSKLNEKKNDN